MAVTEEISITTIILTAAVLGVFLWMIKLTYDVRRLVARSTRGVEEKTLHAENELEAIKAEILHLNALATQKADAANLEKRLNDIVTLARKQG